MLIDDLIRLGRPLLYGDLKAEEILRLITGVNDVRVKNFYRNVFVIELPADDESDPRALPRQVFGSETDDHDFEVAETQAIGAPFVLPSGGNPLNAQGRYGLPIYPCYDPHLRGFRESAEIALDFLQGRLARTPGFSLTEAMKNKVAKVLHEEVARTDFHGEKKVLGVLILVRRGSLTGNKIMSHKRSKIEGAPGVQLGLIITPMLDMSFQILAFFIMTYHPSALEGHIPGSLTPPEDFAKKSKDTVAQPNEPNPSLDENNLDLSLNEAVTVIVKAVVKGQDQSRIVGAPSQIFLRTNLDTTPQMLEKSDVLEFKDALKSLEARLKEMGGKGSKTNLKIAADGGLRYQYVLMVYDAAKKAGFEKIHFVPPAIKAKLKN